MMIEIKTFINIGLEGYEITIEADENNALPTIDIIGLPDAAIKESKERLRGTFRNTGVKLPDHKIILNLAPSDIKKTGTSFDLAMAVAILSLILKEEMFYKDKLKDFLFFGELGLDGRIKRVSGILPSIIASIKKGYKYFFVPYENKYELEYIPDIKVYPVKNFFEIIDCFSNGNSPKALKNQKKISHLQSSQDFQVDFGQIKGQLLAKRACTIAASGLHNMLFVGSPGSGKTMLSKAIQSILPPLSYEEILHISQIYSIIGKLNKDLPLITNRPFRQVHHTASSISIVGGGRNLVPGEISLSHKGILFFDELTEFPREVLEVLRQPIEDKIITISRATGSVQYPADFMFIASMNPCKCGYYKDKNKQCTCSVGEIKRYQSRISGPLLDRIDMILEIPREKIDKLLTNTISISSEEIRKNVINSRKIQKERYKNTNIISNSGLSSKDISKYIILDSNCKDFIFQISEKLGLSARLIHRIMKLSRTIADLDNKTNIEVGHISEAIQYRDKGVFIDQN